MPGFRQGEKMLGHAGRQISAMPNGKIDGAESDGNFVPLIGDGGLSFFEGGD